MNPTILRWSWKHKQTWRRLLKRMEMVRQILRSASLACGQRELEHGFFDHLVGHLGMQDVAKKLNTFHQPWPWKAEARVIADVDFSPLHCRYGPEVRNSAQDLHLQKIAWTHESWIEYNYRPLNCANTRNDAYPLCLYDSCQVLWLGYWLWTKGEEVLHQRKLHICTVDGRKFE